jgi:hypothetical protein
VSYDRRIDREHPSLVLLLIDQSGSMSATMGEDHRTRAQAVADAVNGLLFELVLRCVKDAEEGPRPYYDVGVIGYSIRDQVGPAFSGELEGRRVVSSVDLAEHPLRLDEQTNGSGGGCAPSGVGRARRDRIDADVRGARPRRHDLRRVDRGASRTRSRRS